MEAIAELLALAIKTFFAIVGLELALCCFALAILLLPLEVMRLAGAPSASESFFKMGLEIIEGISQSFK